MKVLFSIRKALGLRLTISLQFRSWLTLERIRLNSTRFFEQQIHIYYSLAFEVYYALQNSHNMQLALILVKTLLYIFQYAKIISENRRERETQTVSCIEPISQKSGLDNRSYIACDLVDQAAAEIGGAIACEFI